jgi:hypothetical protein
MNFRLRLHRLAVAEIDHEVDYYESRQSGLGAELEDELDHAFSMISYPSCDVVRTVSNGAARFPASLASSSETELKSSLSRGAAEGLHGREVPSAEGPAQVVPLR